MGNVEGGMRKEWREGPLKPLGPMDNTKSAIINRKSPRTNGAGQV